jgi:hypothetical protein
MVPYTTRTPCLLLQLSANFCRHSDSSILCIVAAVLRALLDPAHGRHWPTAGCQLVLQVDYVTAADWGVRNPNLLGV